MTKIYRSKVDGWLKVILGSGILISVAATVSAIAAGGWRYLWSAAITIFFSLFIIWILCGTHYVLDGKILTIKSGPFRWRVPVDEMHSITLTNNPLSSPALSLDRVRIEYTNGKAIMISPEDKDELIADIKATS
ncbi:PH domain-containing protein [Leptolyngbya sp. 7M]|uniref:PH domain-containing protein n=1 Tax=Leptolyngbya sp. 7M TaxID=2812896 RepID=UPI001B8BFEA2|nr:PH domain-containing protein [Leptolyngbya sp. 7M]QYO65989.1 PH domain-containing protein [Leptolyngbya sp. 7M]